MRGEKEGVQKVKNDNGPPSEHKLKVITKPNKVHLILFVLCSL